MADQVGAVGAEVCAPDARWDQARADPEERPVGPVGGEAAQEGARRGGRVERVVRGGGGGGVLRFESFEDDGSIGVDLGGSFVSCAGLSCAAARCSERRMGDVPLCPALQQGSFDMSGRSYPSGWALASLKGR